MLGGISLSISLPEYSSSVPYGARYEALRTQISSHLGVLYCGLEALLASTMTKGCEGM